MLHKEAAVECFLTVYIIHVYISYLGFISTTKKLNMKKLDVN